MQTTIKTVHLFGQSVPSTFHYTRPAATQLAGLVREEVWLSIKRTAYGAWGDKFAERIEELYKSGQSFCNYSIDWSKPTNGARWTTALAKQCYQRFGLKIDKEHIGNLIAPIERERKIALELYRGPINWEDGEYGDTGSCYWGERAYAKTVLEELSHCSIRAYLGEQIEDGQGIGRCWGVPIQSGLVLFNAYGADSSGYLNLHFYAEALAAHLSSHGVSGFDWKEVSLTANQETCGTLYINHAIGIYFGKPESKVFSRSRLDISYEDETSRACCDCCGTCVDEDDLTYIECEGNSVCRDCLDNYVYLDSRGDYVPQDIVSTLCEDDTEYVITEDHCTCGHCDHPTLELIEWRDSRRRTHQTGGGCTPDICDCAECGENWETGSLDDNGTCPDCAESRRVREYNRQNSESSYPHGA